MNRTNQLDLPLACKGLIVVTVPLIMQGGYLFFCGTLSIKQKIICEERPNLKRWPVQPPSCSSPLSNWATR